MNATGASESSPAFGRPCRPGRGGWRRPGFLDTECGATAPEFLIITALTLMLGLTATALLGDGSRSSAAETGRQISAVSATAAPQAGAAAPEAGGARAAAAGGSSAGAGGATAGGVGGNGDAPSCAGEDDASAPAADAPPAC